MVMLYCEVCSQHQEVVIDPLKADDLNGPIIWGDIVCSECHFTIACARAKEPGIYAIVKVADLPKRRHTQNNKKGE